jgi:hypothetical protein
LGLIIVEVVDLKLDLVLFTISMTTCAKLKVDKQQTLTTLLARMHSKPVVNLPLIEYLPQSASQPEYLGEEIHLAL